MTRTTKVSLWLMGVLCALPLSSAHAAQTVTVTLDPSRARATAVPADFAGLSIEMNAIRFNFQVPNGSWLSGTNSAYIAMLRRIGIRNLRIGGNTSERDIPADAYPSDVDAARTNDFANAIQAKLLWGLPVAVKYNPAFFSAYAARMLADQRQKGHTFPTVFQMGNEPDLFGVSLATYQSHFDGYADALEAAIGSGVRYLGPSAAGNRTYASRLVANPRYQGALRSRVAYITHHWYPFGGASSYATPAAAIATMLGNNNSRYQSFYDGWARNARTNGFAPRIEETNSIYQGGRTGASESFAASLWAVDYLCYFSHNTDLAGINFHTANKNSPYNAISPIGLAASYTLRGVGYGLLAFEQRGQGRPVPRTIVNTANVNLTAYATLRSDGTQSLLLVNKTHSANGVDANVVVIPGRTYTRAQVMYLRAPNNNPAATTGITLGGQSMNGSGVWNGTFTQTVAPVSGRFTISVPRTQAAIVVLS